MITELGTVSSSTFSSLGPGAGEVKTPAVCSAGIKLSGFLRLPTLVIYLKKLLPFFLMIDE